MMNRASKGRGRRWSSLYGGLIAAFAGLWVLGFALFVLDAIQSEENPGVAPVAVVFTGGAGRIQEGLRLLENGEVQHLFVSGVTEGTTPAVFESVYPAALSLKNGALSLGYKATTTQENAKEVSEWFIQNYPEGKEVCLITSDYHMARSLKEMRQTMPKNVRIVLHPLTSRGVPWVRRLGHFFSEYNKFLVQYVMYTLQDLQAEATPQQEPRT